MDMLRRMVLIRRFDQIALRLVQAKEINGVVHPYIGQEASAVGICSALRPGDRVVSNHRGHGHCIAAGTGVDRMMAELFGRATGSCKGKGGSMHIADFDVGMLGANGIVGGGVPMAVGAAFSDDLDGADTVNVTFFGDGALGQGILYECLNMTALWKLPVLFVCENNGIAGLTSTEVVTAFSEVTAMVNAHGVPGETVDGSDVIAVHAATAAALERMRAGEGPYLIECVLDRWEAHASRVVPVPDRRDPGELEAMGRERDPIARLRARLEGDGHLDAPAFERLCAEVEKELDAALEFAAASPYPTLEQALEDVFA
jgi:pyruvate dehydrogenase E1 component alpha subunit